MSRRVVITGVGCVTPLGTEVDAVWDALREGRSGVGPITLFDASNFPVRIAAEVCDWDMSDIGEDPSQWQHHARQTQFAVASAVKASQSAGLDDVSMDPALKGVYLGCGEIFPDFLKLCQSTQAALDGDQFQLDKFVEHCQATCPVDEALVYEPGIATTFIAGMLDAQGPNMNIISACTSSSTAIGEAREAIRRGDADVMLAGGAHSMIHPFGVAGFHRLATLSTHNDEPDKASRPFDRDRDGFVIGEGGVVFVLEALEHARRRRADIWGELTGYGANHDAYRITDPHPESARAADCIKLALDDARLNTDQIDYINAHGTATVFNDKSETVAVKRALGERAYTIPISSTKSMTGHLTTASGAMELLVGLMAICNSVVPATLNYEHPDPDCDLDYVPAAARDIHCQHAISNNFGFGGHNSSLIVSRRAA